MEKDIVNFLKKSKKKARQDELTKPLIENKKQNTKANIKLHVAIKHQIGASCCYSSKKCKAIKIYV